MRYAKEQIRQITRINLPISIEDRVSRLNSFLSGWVVYFQLVEYRSHLAKLDDWISRKLRCVRLKQCKRTKAIAEFLLGEGVRADASWTFALSGKGWWRLADTPQAHKAMTKAWLKKQGLVSLIDM